MSIIFMFFVVTYGVKSLAHLKNMLQILLGIETATSIQAGSINTETYFQTMIFPTTIYIEIQQLIHDNE